MNDIETTGTIDRFLIESQGKELNGESRWAQDDQSAYQQDYVGGAQPSQPIQPQYVEAAPAAPAADPLEQLTKLGQLHESGVLTDAEFEAQKAKILAR